MDSQILNLQKIKSNRLSEADKTVLCTFEQLNCYVHYDWLVFGKECRVYTYCISNKRVYVENWLTRKLSVYHCDIHEIVKKYFEKYTKLYVDNVILRTRLPDITLSCESSFKLVFKYSINNFNEDESTKY